jgi:hypothetical protein
LGIIISVLLPSLIDDRVPRRNAEQLRPFQMLRFS